MLKTDDDHPNLPDDDDDEKEEINWKQWSGRAALGFVAALGIVVVLGLVLWSVLGSPSESKFTSFQVVASVLAFGALVVAVFLQRKELQLQRKELRMTRREFEGQREALEQQVQWMQTQAKYMEVQTEVLEARFAVEVRADAPDFRILKGGVTVDRGRKKFVLSFQNLGGRAVGLSASETHPDLEVSFLKPTTIESGRRGQLHLMYDQAAQTEMFVMLDCKTASNAVHCVECRFFPAEERCEFIPFTGHWFVKE